ncbi:MAG: hypothetical protein IT204_08055 [Fimbriimonadaceae bacterium]|nr:hypothetical protein [Fimbriimonadaceae bacterium]
MVLWCLVVLTLGAADDSALFQRGRCRELFISGLPQEPADLAAWAATGVNCAFGAQPAAARAAGLATRGWFTLNYMDSRSHDESWIRARAAVRQDGSFLRPADPLFPTIAQYGWTACVNNPLWLEFSREHFRGLAQQGHRGVHVDYASHYESCFCPHCLASWTEFAAARQLAPVLTEAIGASDLPTRMALREWRIRCVMDFLGDLRRTARAIVPGFGLDGTYHQDSGSTYQWAYGDHYDLMCIEGTTHGAFPPGGTQIPWLKVAHALSERPTSRPAAMSVTYHLLTDEQGALHHGRMAPDRLRLALAEIVSQGAVSWLGLGGPGTGNLLREHLPAVRAYFALARDLADELATAQELGEIGLLFSPRSYLLSSQTHRQCLAFAQALQKAQVPYRVVSDVGLQPAALSGLTGLVMLDAPALEDDAIRTVDGWLRGGGRALLLGAETARYGADWRDRATRPEWATPPAGEAPLRQRPVGRGATHYWLEDAFGGTTAGATQYVALNQTTPGKVVIEGWSKAEGVSGQADSNYALYVDLLHQDGTPLWGQVARFSTGSHDWEFSRCVINSEKPLKSASVHLLFRNHGGRVWFRNVKFGPWDEAQQAIARNLLNESYRQPDGQKLLAAGAAPDGESWAPYGEGYRVETMYELGLWLRCEAKQAIEIPAMHVPLSATDAKLLAVVAPLRAAQPLVRLTGRGAELVTVDLQRTPRGLLVHLLNHAATLDPRLTEAEQQAREHSLPTGELTLELQVPGLRLPAASTTVRVPEGPLEATVTAAGDGLRVRLNELRQYAVVQVR